VKEAVSVPVSGNGDITTIDYGIKRWKETGTDGILIGRGAMQNPWIFRQFEDVLAGREPYQPDLQEKKDVLLEFFSMCREEMPELVALGKMKQLAGQFTKGLVGGAQFRQTLYHSHSADEILDNITTYFETLERRQTFGDGFVEAVRTIAGHEEVCERQIRHRHLRVAIARPHNAPAARSCATCCVE
jgi:tRNA-dihydrouridine synthase